MTAKKRAEAIESFQRDPGPTVFLLSVRSGAVGINLTSANYVFLMEPCMNPALEVGGGQWGVCGGRGGCVHGPHRHQHTGRVCGPCAIGDGGHHGCSRSKRSMQKCSHSAVCVRLSPSPLPALVRLLLPPHPSLRLLCLHAGPRPPPPPATCPRQQARALPHTSLLLPHPAFAPPAPSLPAFTSRRSRCGLSRSGDGGSRAGRGRGREGARFCRSARERAGRAVAARRTCCMGRKLILDLQVAGAVAAAGLATLTCSGNLGTCSVAYSPPSPCTHAPTRTLSVRAGHRPRVAHGPAAPRHRQEVLRRGRAG